jgi:chemotaxis protein CheX
MSAILEINENLIRSHITRAVADVFKTMLSRPVELCPKSPQGLVNTPPPATCEPAGKVQVVGTVGFLGDISGLIYLHFDLEFARLCTCQLLGMTNAELEEAGDEVINDAIGEITNMTVGSFKNGLCDAGFPCKLTIPSILRGSNFCVEPISSAQRHIYRFQCAGSTIMADILMKCGD